MKKNKPRGKLAGIVYKFNENFSSEDIIMTISMAFLGYHYQRISDLWASDPSDSSGIINGIIVGTPILVIIALLFIYKFTKKRTESDREDEKVIIATNIRAFTETHMARMTLFNLRFKEMGSRMNIMWASFYRKLKSYTMAEMEVLATENEGNQRLQALIDQVEQMDGDMEELGEKVLREGIKATLEMKKGFLTQAPKKEDLPVTEGTNAVEEYIKEHKLGANDEDDDS